MNAFSVISTRVVLALGLVFTGHCADAAARGPLRLHPTNPRYFTDGTTNRDGSFKAVFLTGSHHWNNLQDSGRLGGPLTNRFDYEAYLKRLTDLNHNFIRLWAWEGPAWWFQGGQNDQWYEPLAWARTGRGPALDGKPKFDLNQFNEEYFNRLRSRVIAARDRGIYVSVMLFQGWSIYSHGYGNPWPGHPLNRENNVNGVDGDPNRDGEGKEVHTLEVPAVTRRQEAYVRKVIDTVNDLENVLYEITNETALWSRDWQYHMIRFIKQYQATKPRQHPVGITAFDSGGEGSMAALLASPADWISPQNDGTSGDYTEDPPAADGRKVIISDTDHLWGVGGSRAWVWKSFTRGHHPIYMDPLRKLDWVRSSEAEMEGARQAMGHARRFATRMNLASLTPEPKLASTRYCLARPGREYLVYQPKKGAKFTVELPAGDYRFEWFNPAPGENGGKGEVKATGGAHTFQAPFAGDSVLYLCAAPARGPLRVHPDNPRYFTDGTKLPVGSWKAVYLTGAHTWNNLVDMGRKDPPEAFDFEAYLNFLEKHHHNFIRLWAWDSTTWDTRANGSLGKDFIHHAAPLPWLRTGPGNALDGKPKFDLTRFDPAYFERLRSRVTAAGERGIYVSVMLFEGWGLYHGNRRSGTDDGWAWRTHPFNPANNVNGPKVEGAEAMSGRVHTLRSPEVNKFQAAYIRKVVDTLNDLDNVLYEVLNEGGEKEWNWWVIQTIHEHQRSKPKQHPVGNTGHGAERLPTLLASPAEWISPGRADGYGEDPPAWNEKKVSLLDTDHIWGVGGNRGWVWKSFMRGHNPLFMDPYDGSVLGQDRGWEPIRQAMGHTRRFAERVNLAGMRPETKLASTGYCLANPGKEYLVYQPKPGAFTIELKPGAYRVEWFDPVQGKTAGTSRVEAAGGPQEFKAPFAGEAVLYLSGV